MLTEEVYLRYNEHHRFFHTTQHLINVFRGIKQLDIDNENRKFLNIVAKYHDIVYYPNRRNNEEESAKIFIEDFNKKIYDIDQKCADKIVEFIKNTSLYFTDQEPTDELFQMFKNIDCEILENKSISKLLDYNYQIFKEYQFISYPFFKKKRLEFLLNVANSHEKYHNLFYLVDLVKNWKPKIGIYAGSFDPFHNGHMDILLKSSKLFDKVIIAIGKNPEKDSASFNERYVKLKEQLWFYDVQTFEGLLTDFVKEKEDYADITIIRGLRNGYDLDYEMNQLQFMKYYKNDIKVIYIPCDKQFEHISSSALRALNKITNITPFIP
jgi:pantetheine-phosphate adenylyltransferase